MSICGDQDSLTRRVSEDMSRLRKVSNDTLQRYASADRHIVSLQKALDRGDYDGMSRLLSKPETEMVKLLYPEAEEMVERIFICARKQGEQVLNSLLESLSVFACEGGFPVKGQAPNLIVDNLIDFRIDIAKKAVKVGIVVVKSLDWSRLRSAIHAERDRVWARNFSPEAFRDTVVRICGEVLRVNPNPLGWVQLEQVYQLIKKGMSVEHSDGKRMVAYYRDEFSADLSKMWVAQANRSVSLPHMEFSGIRDPRLSYRVILPNGQVSMFGHIRPMKEIG